MKSGKFLLMQEIFELMKHRNPLELSTANVFGESGLVG